MYLYIIFTNIITQIHFLCTLPNCSLQEISIDKSTSKSNLEIIYDLEFIILWKICKISVFKLGNGYTYKDNFVIYNRTFVNYNFDCLCCVLVIRLVACMKYNKKTLWKHISLLRHSLINFISLKPPRYNSILNEVFIFFSSNYEL